MDQDKLEIKQNLAIGRGISEKIKMLSKNQFKNQNILKDNINLNKEVAIKATTLNDQYSKDPFLWKISDNLYVICEATNGRTELISKKNNIDLLVEYLNTNFNDKYLVLSFKRTSISKSFKKCVAFDDINFNLEDAIEISKIARFWIENQKILFVEMKNGKENCILFVLSCILAYCKIYLSAETAYYSLLKHNPLQFQFKNLESVLRYVRYFDNIADFNATTLFPQKNLNQIIITTIPTILKPGTFIPKLKICQKAGTLDISEDKCYHDSNYIIFSHLNVHFSKDLKISLFFLQEKETYHILDLNLNSYFYKQGLYRFTRNDIETLLPQDTIYRFFDENFYIDLVIIENQESLQVNPYAIGYGLVEAVKIVSDHLFCEINDEKYKKLLNDGYNQHLSKVCTLFDYNENECTKLYDQYLEKSHINLKLLQKLDIKENIDKNIIKTIEDSNSVNNEPSNVEFKHLYQEIENPEITEIPLIELNIVHKTSGRKMVSRLFAQAPTTSMLVNNDIFSIKSLHITSLLSTQNTIFNETQNLKINLDLKKFEKYFCENSNPEIIEKKNIEEHKDIIESRRLFIISLCIKQLEMKKILLKDILYILSTAPEILNSQDLTNILKILPTNEEIKLLTSVSEDKLNGIEKAMLDLSKIPEIKSIVTIYMFETWIFDEINRVSKLLKIYNEVIMLLLTSNEFKLLFKILLDVANMINYVYGKKRKVISGFKLESLSVFLSYTGNNNYSLLSYIAEMMLKNNIKFTELKKAVNNIEQIKNEEISNIKDKLNKMILKYTDSITQFNQIQNFDKSNFEKLLGYSCIKLKETTAQYRKLEDDIDLLKTKIGEEQGKSIVTTLETIHLFVVKILEKVEKTGKNNK